MPITPLPNPPSRIDPINFSPRADAFVDALANSFVPEANALENSIIASVSSATSTTTHSMTLGSKTFTVQTGKSFGVNSWLSIVSTSDPSKGMIAQVTSYNSSTGALVVNVTAVTGSGSNSSWFLHYTHPQSILAQQAGLATTGANTFTGAQTLPGDASDALHAVPKQQLDTNIATRALLAGLATQVFSVAAATSSTHAVRLGQFTASVPVENTLVFKIPCTGLPSGATELIVQMGNNTSPPNGEATFSYPQAFPNAVLAAFGNKTYRQVVSTDGNASGMFSVSTTQYTVFADDGGGNVAWIAVGY